MLQHINAVHSPNTLTLKNFGEGLGVDRLKPVLQTKAHGAAVGSGKLTDFKGVCHRGGNRFLNKERFIAAGYGAHNVQMGIVWRRDNQRVGIRIGTGFLYRGINFRRVLLTVFRNQLRRSFNALDCRIIEATHSCSPQQQRVVNMLLTHHAATDKTKTKLRIVLSCEVAVVLL